MRRGTFFVPVVTLAVTAATAAVARAQNPPSPAPPAPTPAPAPARAPSPSVPAVQPAAPAAPQASAESPARTRATAALTGITLTAQQRARVDSVIAYYVQRVPGPVDASLQGKTDTLLMQQDREIRMVLTPAQQGVFDRNLQLARSGQTPVRRPE